MKQRTSSPLSSEALPRPVHLEEYRHRFARLCGAFAIAMGVGVLAGWVFDFRFLLQMLPGQVAMVPNTAIAFLLAGLALWMRAGPAGRWRAPASVAAALAGLLGLLNLIEYVAGRDLGLDELLFKDTGGLTSAFPGRMAVLTAVGFVALSGALLTLDRTRVSWATDGLALLPAVFSMASLTGYAFGVGSLRSIGVYKGMAIHTALAFLALAVGVLLVHERGLSRLLVSDTAGGVVARRVLPVALLAPFVLGWLRIEGQRLGFYGPEVGRALDAVSNAVVLTVVLLGTAAVLMRADERRRLSEEAARIAEANYQVLFESSPLPTWVVDRETLRYLAVNDAAVRQYGYSREEFLSMHIGQIRPPEDVAAVKATIPKEKAGLARLGIWRHLKKDGTPIDVDIATHTLTFEGRSAWLALAYDVTDRLKAEETLRKLSRAVEQSPVSVVITDTKGDIEYVNPKFTQATGYTAAEVHGMNSRLLKSGEQPPELYRTLWETITSGGEWRGEFHNVKKNGELFWEFASISPVSDEHGRITHFLAIKEDITERKRAEEALRASEKRFRSYYELGLVGMAITSPTKSWLDVNDEMCRILGYERDELVTKTWEELTHPDDLAVDVADFRRVLAGEIDGYSIDKRWIRKDGRIVESVISVKGVRRGDGSIDYFVALLHDITARKLAEDALARRERHFRSLIENAQDVITIIDLEGTIQFQSPAAKRILGRPPEEFVGRNAFEFVHPEDAPGVQAALRRLAENPDSHETALFRFRHANGSWRTMDGIGKILPGEGPRQIVVNSRDVTESRAVEDQLRQAQKMEAVGRLAGGVAHDFNNLLTAIMGYADLAAGRLTPEDPVREELLEIDKAAHRAAELTRQLLAFSRKQVLQPRVVSLNAIVSNTEKLLRRLIGEDIELVHRLQEPLGSVRADTGQIEQVLVNLAVNSRDAMPQGGRLTIETSEVELDETYSAFHFEVPPGHYVLLAVSDTGTGMDAQTLGHVFEPFFTTKEAGRGTGLGLSMVYGVVKQSGGHVTVYSEAGIGTTFKIYLPRVKDAPEQDRAPSDHATPLGGAETILVVEDEEAVRRLTCRTLEAHGYRVLSAADAHDALALCERHAGQIELLVTDVVMPEMSGRAVARRAALLQPRMKVLFMSGYTDDAIVKHGVLDADASFLQKPFTPRSLAEKVRRVLDS